MDVGQMTISIKDPGSIRSLANHFSHPPPFSISELGSVTALALSGVKDLSWLSACGNVGRLQILGSVLSDMEPIARQESLRVLSIVGSEVVLSRDVMCNSSITELDVSFSTVPSILPLMAMPNLSRLAALGIPCDTESRQLLDSSRTDRPRLPKNLRSVSFSRDCDWKVCVELAGRGLLLTYDQIDGIWPVLVRPGIPADGNAAVDVCFPRFAPDGTLLDSKAWSTEEYFHEMKSRKRSGTQSSEGDRQRGSSMI
jgi:hypothetical protein